MNKEKTSEKIEYSDDCPICKKPMKKADKKNEEHLFYYCLKCNQKYRIEVVHPSQIIDCPHCKGKIRLNEKILSDLHFATAMNFYVRKTKVN